MKLFWWKKTEKADLPFASEPAEAGYQAAKTAGAKIDRDQFRVALRALTSAEEASKRAYEKFRDERAVKESESWFSKETAPNKPGVYHTSRKEIAHLGGSKSYWDGEKWSRYKNWGDYLNCYDFVWVGEGASKNEPIKES